MSVVTLTINGRLVSAAQDETILQAARSAKIEIPTLCYVDGLSAHGGCRSSGEHSESRASSRRRSMRTGSWCRRRTWSARSEGR